MSLGVAAVLAAVLAGPALTPVAQADPVLAAYLDLPAPGGDGSTGGGLDPGLPLDVGTLRAAVEQARAEGLAPHRYATLLHQYWLAVSTANAGIDLASWDPHLGSAANAATFTQVYVNYLRLATTHPDFYWAGLAGLAGGSFASGFFDIGDLAPVVGAVHQLGETVADLIATTPPELAAMLPPDLRLLATAGPRLSPQDMEWYRIRLMTMQKHIFIDQVPMHEAYAAEGMPAIEEMAAAGILDDNAVTAWRDIDSGTAAGLDDALLRMTDREQNQIIADQWDQTSAGRGDMGRVLTYVTTIAGKAAVPGTRAPGVYAPLTVHADVDGHPMSLRLPLPDFNWADRDTRWAYITADLVPRCLDLDHDPARAQVILGEPFAAKLEHGRLLSRLPDLITDLTGQWSITAG
ncbi:hypothetical protein [Nocardia stercoris]|uniref:Tat pathway signal protein n=1 Tax=Nocardia stercoris TaxID=2483361 RepID=A0A3M2L2V8_9NOCA|nr:hypothetical protein [Nocardia stercoris]RMI30195.1 hypothetical protein EBN03_23580 [Nocardia stercoris]